MTPVGKLIVLFSLALLTACGAPEADAPTAANNTQSAKLSSFGVYEGYSTAQYSEWVRTSQYVAMRDGVKLAVDVVRPAVDGAPVEEALPVVYTLQRYGRAHLIPGRPGVSTPVDTTSYIRNLVEHGYVYVSVGIRGSGASFGAFPGVHAANEARDAYDIAEWIVSQEWSNGVVGMMGNSYRANASLMAVSAPHPARQGDLSVDDGFRQLSDGPAGRRLADRRLAQLDPGDRHFRRPHGAAGGDADPDNSAG